MGPCIRQVRDASSETLQEWKTLIGDPNHEEILRLRDENESQRKALAATSEEIETLRQRLRQAEELRRRVLTALGEFSTAFETALSTYRNQRAWQVMLLFRKLYSQLLREGSRGKLELLRFFARLPLDGIPPLGRYDLAFPALLPRVPPALADPLISEDAS